MNVIKDNIIGDFLRKRVKQAINAEAIITSEWAEFYLVNLLQQYLLADKLFENSEEGRQEQPLAILLLTAMNDNKISGKIVHLRQLGDNALYMSGVFKDHIVSKKMVSIDYYKSMGAGAYLSLSSMLSGDDLSDLYKELAENFVSLAHVLAAATICEGELSATELLKTYERWLKTGDENHLKILKRYGLITDESEEVQ